MHHSIKDGVNNCGNVLFPSLCPTLTDNSIVKNDNTIVYWDIAKKAALVRVELVLRGRTCLDSSGIHTGFSIELVTKWQTNGEDEFKLTDWRVCNLLAMESLAMKPMPEKHLYLFARPTEGVSCVMSYQIVFF